MLFRLTHTPGAGDEFDKHSSSSSASLPGVSLIFFYLLFTTESLYNRYLYIYIHLFIYIIYRYYDFYLLLYISIYIFIYYIYLTLPLLLLLLIKRVSFKIQVSQPAVTDDSYLRTDVKPPKLGKGALQYVYVFFYICTVANARRIVASYLLRYHRCTSLSRTHTRAVFFSSHSYDLDLMDISPINFVGINIFELSLNPLIRNRSLPLSFYLSTL